MEFLLVSATAASVGFAIFMVAAAIRAGNKHARSIARIEALRVLAAQPAPEDAAPADLRTGRSHPFVVTLPEQTPAHPYQVSFNRKRQS